MKKIATLILACLLFFSGYYVHAQQWNDLKKSSAESPHPTAEITVHREATIKPDMPINSSSLQVAPAYGAINSPIRWYALENAQNASYWESVDMQRIWIEWETENAKGNAEIEAFLQKHELNKVITENGFRSHTNFSIYENTNLSPAAIVAMAQEARELPLIKFLEPSTIYKAMSTPNDPYWQYQWGPYVINAEEAWDYTTGGSWNVIAVIDDAIDWNHPELYDQVWYGYDYGMNDNDPTPDHFSQNHGTHVTGTIAAKMNNNQGIAGMVNDTVYFAKVTDATYDPESGNFSDVAIVNALYDIALYDRIGVINMSLGGGAPSAAMEQACNQAWNNGKILVVASGNESDSEVSYPAAFPACMAVGSVGADGTNMYFAAYSNYGSEQEIVAPGGDQGAGFGILSTVLFNEFDAMEGTSMACPHVAGVAGLIKAANPDLTNFEVRNILNATATDYGNAGWDPIFGYGMVNAGLAVQTALGASMSNGAVQNSGMSIALYPNPAAESLYLDSKGLEITESIEVYDLSGKRMHTHAALNKGLQKINIQHLPQGMYIVRVATGDGWMNSKFVKQ